MNSPANFNTQTGLAADAKSLGNLKLQAGKNSPTAIKEAAKQFESLFMREVLKSMREATMKSGMLDSPQGNLGNDMLDQQLAVQMSGRPGGLSDLIAQQLSQQTNAKLEPGLPTVKAPPTASSTVKTHPHQEKFVQKLGDAAEKVARESGIPSSYMIGQAGHETGWGKFEIKQAGGAPSFNLFGIKAGPGWKGKVAEVTTTEYVNGMPQKTVARFRAYNSYEESFRDYAKLISDSPRYADARRQVASVNDFALGLQKAGYATDPQYAAKLSRAINATLQLQRAQA